MKYLIRASLLLCSLPAFAQPHIGIDAWGWHLDGQVRNQGDSLDFSDDLQIDARGSSVWQLGWRSDGGWWPSVAGQYSRLRADGEGQVPAGTSFGPITFTAAGPVLGGDEDVTVFSETDFTETDLLLSWRLPWWGLDAGLRVRRLDGDVLIQEQDGESDRQDFDETVPLLHLAKRWGGEAFSIGLRGDWISDGDSSAYEWAAGFRWAGFGPLAINFEWQRKRYDILTRGGDYQLDAQLSGPRLGLEVQLPSR